MSNFFNIFFIILFSCGWLQSQSESQNDLQLDFQSVLPLYPNGIPNSTHSENEEYSISNTLVDSLTYMVSVPDLKVFLPDNHKKERAAVIICPGGGYGGLLTKREGSDVAKEFNKYGIAAFVVKYRLPNESVLLNPSIGPLQDLQTAIKMVREHSSEWNINPNKIGVMGFSAGGHLAASAGVHNATYYVDSTLNDQISPDFMLLINPVISFTEEIGHLGSRDNLLGINATASEITFFSNELQVNESTSPTFLVHNVTDSVVLVENSLQFFKQLRKFNIDTELHIYGKGEHGFLTWPLFGEWFGRCINWMKSRELIE